VKIHLPIAVAVALVAPIGVATAGIAWVAAGERAGLHPFAGLTPQNGAEAAALADASDLLRFLERGEDPHAVHPVRPEVISSAILRATTVEAAMWSRQVEMIKLLDREGVIRGDEQRASLACLALDLQLDEVVEYLAPWGAISCEPGQALARVTARTHPAGGGR
jgi:hypothetical protein